jgi:hypothetical protein
MFKNRKFEVKVVKDEEAPPPQVVVQKLDLEEAIVYSTLAVSAVIGVYFLGSTLRACAVHTVAVKVAT